MQKKKSKPAYLSEPYRENDVLNEKSCCLFISRER